MTTFTETNRVGDVLKREFDQLHNRETVTIASGTNALCGLVVGKITASGKYAPWDADAADGSETVAGVVLFDTDASAADATGVILARGPAVVAKGALVWGPDVADSAEQAVGIAGLAALGIIARDSI